VSTATLTPPVANPLSSEHHRELALAKQRAKPIHKAARMAAFNGWATAIVAACAAPFALHDLVGLLLTVCFAVVAFNELRGRRRLLEFDPEAARLLGYNQLGLMALIVAYCAWMLYTGLTTASPFSAEWAATPELEALLGSDGNLDELYRQIVVLLYGTVILLTVIFQGLNAWYYFTRRRHVEDYLLETPEWVRDLERA
jgi:hypothetical protein